MRFYFRGIFGFRYSEPLSSHSWRPTFSPVLNLIKKKLILEIFFILTGFLVHRQVSELQKKYESISGDTMTLFTILTMLLTYSCRIGNLAPKLNFILMKLLKDVACSTFWHRLHFLFGLEWTREPESADRRKCASRKSFLDSKSSLLHDVLINERVELGHYGL